MQAKLHLQSPLTIGHYLFDTDFTLLNSLPKHPTNETTNPKNEIPSPNVVAEPLDVKISAIPNRIIEIPKSDKRILHFSFFE